VIIRFISMATLLLATSQAMAGQNVVVVLDDSGSMRNYMRRASRVVKVEAARQALLTVLEKLPADAQVGVIVLNGGGRDHWIIPLGPVNGSGLRAAIEKIRASGRTPLGARMKDGADALLAKREQQRYGTYKLLIVTDGEAGDRNLVDLYLPDIISRGIVVDVIGVDMRQDHSLATRVHTYRRADDPQSLRKAIAETVLSETAADSGDAGESDFELLAGLPGEVATAALAALAGRGNHPIGQPAPSTEQPKSKPAATAPAPATVPAPATAPPAAPQQGGTGVWQLILTAFCACGVFVALIIGLLAIAGAKR
jgi:hypothetical protein